MIVSVLALFASCFVGVKGVPPKHVILAGISGLSSVVLEQASTPVIDLLKAQGSWTLSARAQAPPTSLANWASILTSTSPSYHGVFSDDWSIDEGYMHPVTGYCLGFPTIFSMVQTPQQSFTTSAYITWSPITQLLHLQHVDQMVQIAHLNASLADEWATGNLTSHILSQSLSSISFIQFSQVRLAGLEFGWASQKQLAAISAVDSLLKKIRLALEHQDLLIDAVIIVTADHGGCGTMDGVYGRHYLVVPWIISSYSDDVGIRKGHQIDMPVSSMDTASTIMYMLGLPPILQSTGRPVLEAFSSIPIQSLESMPGYGSKFSWTTTNVDPEEGFDDSNCFKGKERCAYEQTVVNTEFFKGFFIAIVILSVVVSACGLFMFYVELDETRPCIGFCNCPRILSKVADDFRVMLAFIFGFRERYRNPDEIDSASEGSLEMN